MNTTAEYEIKVNFAILDRYLIGEDCSYVFD